MAGWPCPNCRVVNEDDFDLCYACGTARDSTPLDTGIAREDLAPIDPADRRLDCLRCHAAMDYAGRRRFHEGSQAAPFVLGNLGELFVRREMFDLYACPDCGKIEMFLPAP